jgi:hypothetical protein
LGWVWRGLFGFLIAILRQNGIPWLRVIDRAAGYLSKVLEASCQLLAMPAGIPGGQRTAYTCSTSTAPKAGNPT